MTSSTFLGGGTFGRVELIDGNPPIARKHIVGGRFDEKAEKAFEREWTALNTMRHPNIVKMYDFKKISHDNCPEYVIEMEYCERGSLNNVLKDRKIFYTMKTVLTWAEQLFASLEYLAHKQILHRDIKPDNILVTKCFDLKLGDFGCSKILNQSSAITFAGSARYMSPEAFGVRDIKRVILLVSDIYSMGLVCWEIIERRTVFSKYGLHDFNQFALFNDLSHDRFTLPQVDCVHPIREIIASCTNFYHEKRPDARSVYKKVCEYNSTYKDFEFTPCFGPGTALLRPIGFDGTNMEVAVEMGGDGEEESLPSSTSTTLYHTIPRGSIKKREASISTGGFEKRSTKAQRKSWTEIVFPSFLKLLFSRGHGPP